MPVKAVFLTVRSLQFDELRLWNAYVIMWCTVLVCGFLYFELKNFKKFACCWFVCVYIATWKTKTRWSQAVERIFCMVAVHLFLRFFPRYLRTAFNVLHSPWRLLLRVVRCLVNTSSSWTKHQELLPRPCHWRPYAGLLEYSIGLLYQIRGYVWPLMPYLTSHLLFSDVLIHNKVC